MSRALRVATRKLEDVVDASLDVPRRAIRWLDVTRSPVGRAFDGIAWLFSKGAGVVAVFFTFLGVRRAQKAFERLSDWLDDRVRGGLSPICAIVAVFGLDAATRPSPLDLTAQADVTVIPLPPPTSGRRPPRPPVPEPTPPPTPAPAREPRPGLDEGGDRVRPDVSPDRGARRDVLEPKYQWQDASEAAVFGMGRTTYDASMSIDAEVVRRAIDGYGLRTEDGVYFAGEEAEHQRTLATRGFVETPNRILRTDYRGIVAGETKHVKPLYDAIVEKASATGNTDVRSLVSIIAGLVQDGLPYRIPEDERHTPKGRVQTAGFLVPVDALTERPSAARAGWGWGDCDTKSATFAALASHIEGLHVIMLVGRGHAFVGVALPPNRGDRYVRHRGNSYVLLESTAPWPLGRIPDSVWVHVDELEIVEIF